MQHRGATPSAASPEAGPGPPDAGAGTGSPGDEGTVPNPPNRRRAAGPSVRPALVVVGIATGLVLLFGIGAALQGSSAPKAPPHPSHVSGTALTAEPAASSLRPIEILGTPPDDVVGAVVVPKGATRTGSTPWDGSTQFSGTVDFELSATQTAVVDFYRSELKARGWSTPNVSAARSPKGATEVIAQRASADGWYWEIGVVVSPTTFSSRSSVTSNAGASTDLTKFTLELFEIPDVQ